MEVSDIEEKLHRNKPKSKNLFEYWQNLPLGQKLSLGALVIFLIVMPLGVIVVLSPTRLNPRAENPETPPDLALFSPTATESANMTNEVSEVSASAVTSPVSIPDGFEGEVEGMLFVFHGDDFEKKKSINQYLLHTDQGENLELKLEGALNYQSGTKIKVTGKKAGRTFRVNQVAGGPALSIISIPQAAPLQPEAKKRIRNAIITINFRNTNERQPSTRTLTQLLSRVAKYYTENSFGQINMISGRMDISSRWHTVDMDAVCNPTADLVTNFSGHSIKGTTIDKDFDFSRYDNLVFIYPIPPELEDCAFAYSYTGKFPNYRFPLKISTDEGDFYFGVVGVISQYIHSYDKSNILIHELGHTLTAQHANYWHCGDKPIGNECASVEYQDIFDNMGYGLGHFSLYHKERMGFKPNLLEVYASGKHTIYGIEKDPGRLQGLKIPTGDLAGNYLYVEKRTKFGIDALHLPESEFNGVEIRLAPVMIGSGDTHLIDNTPDPNGTYSNDNTSLTLANSLLYTNPATGGKISITTAFDTPEYSTVDVNFHPYPDLPQSEIMIDNLDYQSVIKTGEWLPKLLTTQYGPNYFQSAGGGTTNSFEYLIPESVIGRYQVYIWWPESSANASNTTVVVDEARQGKVKRYTVNQKLNGGIWNLLGEHNFKRGSKVKINSNSANGFVVADAVKLVPAGQ